MNSQGVGRGLTALVVLFLLVDAVMKIVLPPVIVEANVPLGVAAHLLRGIGMTLLVCTVLHLVPATSVLGAVLLTGYLGGAVAIQVRAGMGWFPVLFPVGTAALVWAGLLLRNPRVRGAFLPGN